MEILWIERPLHFKCSPFLQKEVSDYTHSIEVIIIYCILHYAAKPANTSQPISLKDFSVHVATMHRGKNHGFEIEYEVYNCLLKDLHMTYVYDHMHICTSFCYRALVLQLLQLT